MNASAQQKRKPNGSRRASRAGAAVRDHPNMIGMGILAGVLVILSVLAGVRFNQPVKLFVAGEVATQDVTSGLDMLVEDHESTLRKRQQVAEAQPSVFDLSQEPGSHIRERVDEIFGQINAADKDDLEKVRWQIAERLNTEINAWTISAWRRDAFQQLVRERMIPWVQGYLKQGVVGERRLLLANGNAIIIRDLGTDQERLTQDLASIHDLESFHSQFEEYLRNQLDLSIRLRRAALSLISPMVTPSLTLNRETTQKRKAEVMAAVEPVYYQIKKGEVIVRQGERVGSDQQRKIQALFFQQRKHFQAMQAGGIFILGFLFLLGLYVSGVDPRSRKISIRDAAFIAMVILLFGVMAKVLGILKEPLAEGVLFADLRPALFPLLLPTAGAAGILALFFPASVCFYASLLLSFYCSKLAGGGIELFVFYFLGAMFNTFFIKQSSNRIELLTSIFPLLGSLLLAWSGVSLLGFVDPSWVWKGAIMVSLNGFLALLSVLALSPIAEHLFSYTSRFKLMELMNLEQPLLQELMVNAPGTYHHSLVVANMVEAGARAIGANPLLSKVAALYHDVGKLKNPQYFIENQFGQANKHDKLAPSMSALVLISHVKKGVELAREHKLGPEIADIIQQHHGTTLISYFYHKAQEQAEAKGEEAVRQEEYRYPGPKPQTKEAGLILLADAIEASSRTLVDPTPSRVKGHIQKLIRNIFTEGQLDESELTLKDLNLLTDAFHRILTGIFHSRIEYPEGAKPEARAEARDKAETAHPMPQ